MTATPAWPRVQAVVNQDGAATVSIAGTSLNITAPDVETARVRVIELIASKASQLGRPLHVTTHDPAGTWPLIVNPDGTVTEDSAQPPRPASPAVVAPDPVQPVALPSTLPGEPARPAVDLQSPAAASGAYYVPQPQPAPGVEVHLPDSREPQGRHSFLTVAKVEQPATQGWRGLATRFGVRMSPGRVECAERGYAHAVSQHWPGPRTIVVANGKGGAGKTPTTALLSAVFARHGGAGVIAWDTNQTRGTLGWRTEQGPHGATVLDLMPHTDRLLGAAAQSADLARYVHHQTRDRYDVLRSQPIQLAADQRVTHTDVDRLWNVIAKYYRLIFIDTGNDESDPVWLQAVEHADQLVVPTTTRADHAEAGALLLDALRARDERSRRLADNAVAIVSQADPRASKTDVAFIANGYRSFARDVVTIPHDPAIVDGILHWDALRPVTQRAWLAAAAAVSRGL